LLEFSSRQSVEGEEPRLLELVSLVRTGIKQGMRHGVTKEVTYKKCDITCAAAWIVC